MKSDLKKIDATNVEVEIQIGSEELAKAKSQTLKKIQPEVSAPGFRKGKVPINVVEKQTDPNYLQSQVIDEALNQSYIQLLDENKLQPIKQPEVELKSFVPYSDLKAIFKIEIIPEIKLGDYSKLKVKKPSHQVTSDDVEEVIASLQKRSAQRKEVKRPAKDGDEVEIDFSGKDKSGKDVSGATGKDYPLLIGSDTFIPGFEKNLVGLSAGKSKTFKLRFPKDYTHKPLANQEVDFTVTVKKVSEVVEPKVDDQFASKVGPFKNVEEMKKDIEAQLVSQKQKESQDQYRDLLIEEIVQKSDIQLPKTLVDEQIESLMLEFKQNLIYRGVTLEEYLKQSSLSEEEFKVKELTPQAENRVSAGLVLSEIARQEKIEVSDEEVEIRMQLMKGQYQNDEAMQKQLESEQARREVASRLMSEKTLARIEQLNSAS